MVSASTVEEQWETKGMMQGGNRSPCCTYLILRNVKSGKNHFKKNDLKTTLNLSIKSFGQVIIFEIGTHYENADIILTIKMLIIHSTILLSIFITIFGIFIYY